MDLGLGHMKDHPFQEGVQDLELSGALPAPEVLDTHGFHISLPGNSHTAQPHRGVVGKLMLLMSLGVISCEWPGKDGNGAGFIRVS